ncbi:MAG: hypothetical protein Q8O07_08260 [Chloroflexota bacterium]|nr:hypothetical protein [Chloroflexota bacterium]
MSPIRVLALALLTLMALAAAGCAVGPPPSCGDNIGGTADTAKFDQSFGSLALVSQSTGQPGAPGQEGAEFAQGTALAIQADSKAEVALRACIQPRSGGASLALDKTQTLAAGKGTFNLGSFPPGSYVVRGIVAGTLVKNFPFVVK